jgi:glycosyltransferase involved in cell wall biosynthesis
MDAPQKIVHLIGALGQFDASQYLCNLALGQVADGQEVTVVAFAASAEARDVLKSHGVKVEIIRKRWGYDPFAARQLVQSLEDWIPTVVHIWGARATQAALTVRRALPEAALLATLVRMPQLPNPWWPNKSLHALDAIAVERDDVRAEFVDAGQGEEKIHVIPPGISTPPSDTHTRRELLTHLGLPSESRLIAVAGPLERWQLVDEAIWSFELIRILHDHTALVIVGDGPELGRLERFTRQVTDPQAVRFVTHQVVLPDLLAHSEIYWQPGTSQAIPSALLAAMASGLPVVASDVPAHQAVIQHEQNGFLVPAAKRAVWARHTDQLLRSEQLRTKFAQAARQTVADGFALSAMTRAYHQLYSQLIATKLTSCSVRS